MKSYKSLVFFVTLLLSTNNTYACQTRAYFSPNGGTQDAIIQELRTAQKSIYIAAYTLTAQKIVLELEAAYVRDVKVKALTDKNQTNMPFSFPFKVEKRYAIMHDKFIIIDNETLITGSYNFTNAAEYKNAENLLIIKDCPGVIKAYQKEFDKLWQ